MKVNIYIIRKGFDQNGNIIYELVNGKGKLIEYDNFDRIIYEGEYLNGQKNGKGKEYKNGKLIFEGEFLNGIQWNGIRKEYNWNDKLSYEGEYLNGQKNGKGKEYWDNGNLRFEGEYLNGERQEKGKENDTCMVN